MIPQHNIYASLVIKRGNSYNIQTIVFKEFFKADRDRFGSVYKNKHNAYKLQQDQSE